MDFFLRQTYIDTHLVDIILLLGGESQDVVRFVSKLHVLLVIDGGDGDLALPQSSR